MNSLVDIRIGIVGLGYVGLPLAIEFSTKYKVVGFDINRTRVNELSQGIDKTAEADTAKFASALVKNEDCLTFTNDLRRIGECNVFIVTVPTPIDEFKTPNLIPLLTASKMIGSVLKKGDVVVYESTVYPGCTEEDCMPVLAKESRLIYNEDFFCGYSPERISPGDKVNTLTKIIKVTSGSTPHIANFIDRLYASIITAGTHRAPSIRVAEASKAIENAQRDVNISFVNELALIFDRMEIDTNDVIEAAATKWNFLKFKPGLVGGHCIAVDPYYLTYKAQKLGYQPEVILSGRRLNDNMGIFVANKVVKLMISKGQNIKNSKALILGVTFKENCPDIRNSRVVDIYNELKQFGIEVHVFDPHADALKVMEEYKIRLIERLQERYDSIILAVSHIEFLTLDIEQFKNGKQAVLFDTKSFLTRNLVDARL